MSQLTDLEVILLGMLLVLAGLVVFLQYAVQDLQKRVLSLEWRTPTQKETQA